MATASSVNKSASGGSDFQENVIRFLVDNWSWFFLILLIAIITAINPVFLTPRSISSMLVSSTLILLMALGQTYVIITAGIDLSIGWTVGLASVICATVMRDVGAAGGAPALAITLGVLAGLGAAIVPGMVNGVLIAGLRIPPFIATIGMFGIVRGAAFLLTDGKNVVGDIPATVRDSLRAIGNGSLLYRIPGFGITWFNQPAELTREQLRGLERLLPYPVLITAVVVVILAFVLARTKFGRHTYAIGDNEEAARRAGINVNRHLIYIYVLASFTAGIAGVLHVFRFTAGAPNSGEAALLDSVAAVVIGGTSLFGGEGRISGTVVGALIIGVLETGLTILAVPSLWKFIVVGLIIIVAVLVNNVQERLEARRVKREEHAHEG
ncbi:MAG: ABC transporter permease [Chloroflexota bacterium]